MAAFSDENAEQKGRGDMHEIQKQPRNPAAKNRRPDNAEEKRGAAVVAEKKKPLCRLPIDASAAIERAHALRAGWIPAREPHEKRRRAGARHAEERLHHTRKHPLHGPFQTQRAEQIGAHEKRKERRYDHLCAQPERRHGGSACRFRIRNQPHIAQPDGEACQKLRPGFLTPILHPNHLRDNL